ncbi:MAG: chlororespiratory reduction protein 7 [Oscillatoriales cyanobacterium RM1_1_9]|nr:chlororespiratory reduction protein 7 [Oscillatoriales cyanobacterium SM2_3_0]NJO44823.1 chlororespiratory reduction protein 7 [Oscillatoriales cyanobacterium RM2_1_1]NJO70942.1 chlororespiratory reduction protein 7 [Oscillatoriales cyanobacterium RM1_1_9]
MSNTLMYSEDYFVVLQSGQPEEIITAAELLEKLTEVLATCPEALPQDAQRFTTLPEQAQYLLGNYCDLDLGPGEFIQWYAVRLEK